MLAFVIEDEPGLRVVYRRVLEDVGFDVVEATDGTSALAVLADCVPDIIFLDMLLPTIKGEIILNHILADPRLKRCHTVMISSNKQFERMVRPDLSLQFLLKPVRPAQIREIVNSVLEKL